MHPSRRTDDISRVIDGRFMEISYYTPGLTWLVGFIEGGSRKIKYEIAPSRSEETLKRIFEKHVFSGTTKITDKHASYPGAVRHGNGNHIIVNHSRGFKNLEGFHTNNIGNLWSLLKYEIRKRRGIIKRNIQTFLHLLDFRYENLRTRTKTEV